MKGLQALVLLLGYAGAKAFAAPVAAPSIEDQIRTTLKQRLAALPVEAVHASSMPGLYEVITRDEVLYTDPHADVLFIGKLVDTRTRADLSVQRWNEFHSVDFNALPFKQAIKTVRGDGSRAVAIFADPNCPFCQQLEKNIAGLTNVTIYTFLFPLEEAHPGATVRARSIWCAADPAASWSRWMTEQSQPATATCESDPLAAVHELGNKLIINMTPTVFFSDGHRFAGVMSESEFERQLQGAVARAKR